MKKRELKFPRGYDPKTQAKIGLLLAGLDDLSARLKNDVKDLTVEQLEWQPRTGMNTVGMLLAHLGLVDVWLIKVAPHSIPFQPEGIKIIQKTCGIEDDGIPLGPDGVHPSYLKGFTIEQYFAVMDKGRKAARAELKKWKDKDLELIYNLPNRPPTSWGWSLYHTLEHFAMHYGQIQVLKHMMRDAGVLAK